MQKVIIASILLVILSFLLAVPVVKAEEPNNKFGIHIVDMNDLTDAAKLVNSSGGDWGYVTFVIQKTERDTKKWQLIFDQMRRLHLIPIVRVASQPLGNIWEKLNFDEIDGWISFLNSLNWVAKKRIVAIGNEPNHGKEWGGAVNPQEYAKYLKEFSTKLKASNSDFFILPAGLDASAPNQKLNHMEEGNFLTQMLRAEPTVFDNIDGWNSHSYPNPAFSGSVLATGKGTIKTYLWELNYLKSLGVTKDLAVFITETGWTNASSLKSAENMKIAFDKIWTEPNIVTITPFILNYQDPLFAEFSWKKQSGTYTSDQNPFHSVYTEVQNLPKVAGKPQQDSKGKIEQIISSPLVIKNYPFYMIAIVKNEGQSIWHSYNFTVEDENKALETKAVTFVTDFEPGQQRIILFQAKVVDQYKKISLRLKYKDNYFSDPKELTISTISLPGQK